MNYHALRNTMSSSVQVGNAPSGVSLHSRNYDSSYSSKSTETASTTSDQSKCPKTKTEDDCCEPKNQACYWPLIIFIILFIIVVIVAFCCGGISGAGGCGSSSMWGGGAGIGAAILFFIVWLIILWFFCSCGQMVGAWFFLLFIFAIIFIYWIASALANLNCC